MRRPTRSPRSPRAAPASSSARAPRPTSATACATCPAGSAPACRSTIGSDSQATRDWREELRLLEYGQRLVRRQRNVAAAPELGVASTAERLFERVREGSARAIGQAAWGLVEGARADALVVDRGDDALLGIAPKRALDALVFSSPSAPWRDVMVAGRWVIEGGVHAAARAIGERFAAALGDLAANGGAAPPRAR